MKQRDLHNPRAALCFFTYGLTFLILTAFFLQQFGGYTAPSLFQNLHSILGSNDSSFLSDSTNSSLSNNTGSDSEDECDVYSGKWVFDPNYPIYSSRSCPFLESGFKCEENGRPDHNYTKWRWQPQLCSMPRFNATHMLELLRNKRVIFAGDSLGRNQFQSLLCMLYNKAKNKKSVYDSENKPITNTRSSVVVNFKDYNMTIEYYKSHYLAKEGRRPAGSPRRIRFSLSLDEMDWSEGAWKKADVLVFNSAHWWDHADIVEGKTSFLEGGNANSSMDVMLAYSKFMRYWAEWVDREIDGSKTRVFFRGFAPTHFFGGTWDTGGKCHNETEPWLDEELTGPYPERMRSVEAVVKKMKASVVFLNITKLTDFRKDGHIAIWKRRFTTGSSLEYVLNHQDCSHWCLPGVPDTWNELLYFNLLDRR